MKLIIAAAAAVLLALAGGVAVFAAQPTPHPHGKPTPSPGAQYAPKASPAPEPSESPEASDSGGSPGTHPCNHGFYVSQAAHKHAGGAYVSSVARGDLGKNGSCAAPLPPPPG
jgi:hypothetical protein